MSNEYKEWIQEQTFETLAVDNYNVKLLLLAEQAKNKKLVEALDEISGCTQHKSDFCNHQSDCSFCRMKQAQQALNEVNNAK